MPIISPVLKLLENIVNRQEFTRSFSWVASLQRSKFPHNPFIVIADPSETRKAKSLDIQDV